jgi:glycerol-3-phosphate acyltransferase PlsY
MVEKWLLVLGFCLLGYLSGSLTFSIWVTRLVLNVDVRDAGSGHATTTNTLRQAGWLAGAFVLLLDLTKGFVPTMLAVRYAPYDWVVPAVAGLTVVGHCWPVFANFRGGMGLAAAGSSLLAVQYNYALIGLAFLIILVLVIRHSARAAFFTGIFLAPLMLLVGASKQLIWSSLAVGVVIAIRFLSDWNRHYKELWLDRDLPQD